MDDNYWYIDETGKAGIGTDNLAHNIRPIITIKEKVTLVKGSGTIDDPYIIKDNNSSSLSQSVVGEYIK